MNKQIDIRNGNNIDLLKLIPDNSVDSIVTDPPYGINFLSKDWDSNTGEEETYRQCLRVLKPGGYMLAFSAARTYHHLAMSVERAGFEVKDQIMWLYGSGFPKAQDIGKTIDKRDNGEKAKKHFDDSEVTHISGKTYYHNTTGQHYTKLPDINGDNLAKSAEGDTYGYVYQEVPKCYLQDADVTKVESSTRDVYEHNLSKKLYRKLHDIGNGDFAAKYEGKGFCGRVYQELLPDYDTAFQTGKNEGTKHLGRNFGNCPKCDKPNSYGQLQGGLCKDTDCYVRAQLLARPDNPWAGYKTGLKPAHEPIVVAQKPREGTYVNNCETHGVGAFDIDGCRVVIDDSETVKIDQYDVSGERLMNTEGLNVQSGKEYTSKQNTEGRYPANVLHDGSEVIVKDFPNTKGKGHWPKGKTTGGGKAWGGDSSYEGVGPKAEETNTSAARYFTTIPIEDEDYQKFFYCPKVNKKERQIGMEGFTTDRKVETLNNNMFGKTPMCFDCDKTINGTNDHSNCDPSKKGFVEKRGADYKDLGNGPANMMTARRENQGSFIGNTHPTVKPVALMKYLTKLVAPSNRQCTVLDPFMGSGSTGMAAIELGHNFIGMDLDEEYCEIAQLRIEAWRDKDD